MSSGHPAPHLAAPEHDRGRLRASRPHARRMSPVQCVLSIAVALAVLTGLAAPLVFVGQGPAQAAVTLRSGVYCDGLRPACTQTFATWRGQAVHSTLTFFPDATWSDIEGPDWWYSGWLTNPYASMAVVTIPMLPARGTTADPTPTLANGAKGAYNDYWKVVAQRLIATGMSGVTIRLGHELNGSWYRWSAQKDPAAYAGYWRQIVTTMRSVTGAKFAFDWNVAVGTDAWDATLAWPGDSYVDTVGQDVYDQKWGDASATPAVRWNALVNGAGKFHQGMAFWASFAAAHGKPVSFAEWALVASGASMANGGEGKDDPYYIQHMHDWFASHPTAFEIYFDRTATDGDHVLNGGKFPQAAALYKDLFSKPSTTPSSTATPTPTASATASVTPTVSATPSSTAPSSSPASPTGSASDSTGNPASSDPAASGSSSSASTESSSSDPPQSDPTSAAPSDSASSGPTGVRPGDVRPGDVGLGQHGPLFVGQ